MIKSFLVEGSPPTEFICAMWKSYPPTGAGEDAEVLRQAGILKNEDYERLKVWQRTCGKSEMDQGCLSCPLRRKIVWKTRGPYLVSPDGVTSPVLDEATMASRPRMRDPHYTTVFSRHQTRKGEP
jgi:hypothetical protein